MIKMSSKAKFQTQRGFRQEQDTWHKKKFHLLCNTIPTSTRDREFALKTMQGLMLEVFSVVPMVGGAFAAVDYVISEISAAERSVDASHLALPGALYLSEESVDVLEDFREKGQDWVGSHINEFIAELSSKEICLWLWCIGNYLDNSPDFDASVKNRFRRLILESEHDSGNKRAMKLLRIHNP